MNVRRNHPALRAALLTRRSCNRLGKTDVHHEETHFAQSGAEGRRSDFGAAVSRRHGACRAPLLLKPPQFPNCERASSTCPTARSCTTRRMARPWTNGRPAVPAPISNSARFSPPLEPYKKYVSSFGNLENAATAGSVHSFTPSTWLSCTRPDTGRAKAHMAVTLDQVISKIISQDTPLPSLEVSSETIVQTSAGNNSIYTTLSFRDADSPLPDGNQSAQGLSAVVR